jgi:NAD(P)-dependent dehydrogenase (short-subunit alcohol dehydrogenase family)
MPELYRRLRPTLLDTNSDVIVVAPLGGGLGIDPPAPRPEGGPVPHGAGARALVKTAALELGGRSLRLVDVDPAEAVDDLVVVLADELGQRQAPAEVAWREGRRRTTRIAAAPDRNRGADLPLTKDSVVLLTGGARGITAQVAEALARRSGCHVELVGRSALPEGVEEPAIQAATDIGALRKALVAAGWRNPRDIEKECQRILAAREVAATMSALAEAGSTVTYHQVDVRDDTAFRGVVESVYERHGRLDGVVHGAGMLDDHFIADKDPEAFARVYATKVQAARTLLDAVRSATAAGRDKPAFVVFFGSTAGLFGNRGQADYAAANDTLDAIAASNGDVAGRIFAMDWGPWSSDAGMVSESLAKVFAQGGMGLIDLEDGTGILLDEIAVATADTPQPHQIGVVRCSPELAAALAGSPVPEAAEAGR